MINILISVVFSVLSFCLFNTSICATGINRVMINIPIQLIENCVMLDMYDGTYKTLCFNKEKLEKDVGEYVATGISKYTNDYELSFRYMDPETHSYCASAACRAVKISLSASFMFDYSFSRTMYYEIGGY